MARNRWQKTFAQDAVNVVAQKLGFDRPPDQSRAAAQDRNRMLALLVVRIEQPFLGQAALLPKCVQLHQVELGALGAELLLQVTGEREIDIIAAQQDVLADGDALELQLPASFGNGD